MKISAVFPDGSNDVVTNSLHYEIIRLMECTVHNVTTRAILIGCENFNNNFVNYTVVAELIRDRQIVNTAQLSYTRLVAVLRDAGQLV